MRFLTFLETKFLSLFFLFLLCIFIALFLFLHDSSMVSIFLFNGFFFLFTFLKYYFEYLFLKRKSEKIISQVDLLEKKYLISELLSKPKNLENEAYFYALKQSCKSIHESVNRYEQLQKEYEEYIVSFVHEIKTPLHAISLIAQNDKNKKVLEQVDSAIFFVEQILYYARVKNPSLDYFISEIQLSSVVQMVLFRFKNQIEADKIKLNIHDIEELIYTDEKWLHFLLCQIMMNAIQYFDSKPKVLEIFCIRSISSITLCIRDSGCGISSSDLPRVFEKGFTGQNRAKKKSSGMGLYLVHESVKKLGIGMQIKSEVGVGTEVLLNFPIGDFHLKK